jgi:hypothetical protein
LNPDFKAEALLAQLAFEHRIKPDLYEAYRMGLMQWQISKVSLARLL